MRCRGCSVNAFLFYISTNPADGNFFFFKKKNGVKRCYLRVLTYAETLAGGVGGCDCCGDGGSPP